MSVTYKAAVSPSEYKKCHDIMAAQGVTCKLGKPIIMRKEDGKITGFLATWPLDQTKPLVIAGPLFLVGKRTLMKVVNLISAYEKWIIQCGVRQALFETNLSDKVWVELLDNICARIPGFMRRIPSPYGDDDTTAWYARDFVKMGEEMKPEEQNMNYQLMDS